MNLKFPQLVLFSLCTFFGSHVHWLKGQELRLSNTTIEENQPPETVVGQFFSDSFDAVHYLPGVHDLAISRDYLFYVAGGGDLWVVKIEAEWETGKPIKLVENGVNSVSAGTTKVYYTMEDGSLWELEIFLINILNEPKLTSKRKKLVESDVYRAFPAWEGRIITINKAGHLSLVSADPAFPLNGHSACSLANGFRHCVFVKKDGSLWGFGSNANQQLMQSKTGSSVSKPIRLFPRDVEKVAATDRQTYFTRVDGSLWMKGKGMEKFTNSKEPTARIVTSGVTTLAANSWYCVYLLNDGTAQVFATGLKHQTSPAPMNLGKLNAVLLTAGRNAFAYTQKNGSLWYQKVDKEKQTEDWPKPVEIQHPQAIFLPSSNDNHLFRISGSKLLTREVLDQKRDKPYQIYVRSTDNLGRDVRKEFTIHVTRKDD